MLSKKDGFAKIIARVWFFKFLLDSSMKNFYAQFQHVFGRRIVYTFSLLFLLTYLVKFVFFSSIALHDDEAYYWWWGQRLLFSYPAHPPVIAFFNWMAIKIFGNIDIAPRLFANVVFIFLHIVCVFWALLQWHFSSLKQRAVGKFLLESAKDEKLKNVNKKYFLRLAILLPLLYVFIPHYFALSLIRSDTTMVLFASIAILCVHLAVFYIPFVEEFMTTHDVAEVGFVRRNFYAKIALVLWSIAGICWGLALASKITTFFLLVGYAAFFILTNVGRRVMKLKLFWMHAVIATAIFFVYVFADAQVQFVSLRTLLFRVQGVFSWSSFIAFHAEQPVLFFPTWYLLMALTFLLACVYYGNLFKLELLKLFNFSSNVERKDSPRQRTWIKKWFRGIDGLFQNRAQEKQFFFFIAFPGISYFIVKPFMQNQQANWTVFAPLALVVLLAIIIAEFWENKFWRRSFLYSVYSVFVVYCLLLLMVTTSLFSSPGSPLCLYQKYESISKRFPDYVKNELDGNLQLASPDYKVASIVNLYAPMKNEAIALSLMEKKMGATPKPKKFTMYAPSIHHTLWSITKKESDVQGEFYFFAETRLREGEKGIVNLERKMNGSFSSFEHLKTFTSQCYNMPIAQFHLYRVKKYLHSNYFLEKAFF